MSVLYSVPGHESLAQWRVFSLQLHGFFLQQSKDLHVRPDVERESTLLLVFQVESTRVEPGLRHQFTAGPRGATQNQTPSLLSPRLKSATPPLTLTGPITAGHPNAAVRPAYVSRLGS